MIRLLEAANPPRVRAGERAAFVAEQFAFQHGFGNCRAVDGDERRIGAVAVLVNGAGDEFLARAGFNVRIVQSRHHLSLFHFHALLDEHLDDFAGDFGGNRRRPAGGDVTGGIQHRPLAAVAAATTDSSATAVRTTIAPEHECQTIATSPRTKTMAAAATAIQVLDSGSRAAPRSIRNSSSGVLETLIKLSTQAI